MGSRQLGTAPMTYYLILVYCYGGTCKTTVKPEPMKYEACVSVGAKAFSDDKAIRYRCIERHSYEHDGQLNG